MSYKTKGAALVAWMLAVGVAFTPQNASAQVTGCSGSPPTQQTALPRPVQLGISGGNIHSLIRNKHNGKLSGCFSGTLGSMVSDIDGNEYILSNNHVLADQNRAKPGQDIVQPGLVDVQCIQSPSTQVAMFSRTIKLKFGGGKNRVDAAIAATNSFLTTPEILFIGDIARTIGTPTIGMGVEKMGRTTCLTSGVIASLDANVKVNYSLDAKPKLAKFVDQILVTGSNITPTFSAAGDSGSLILASAECPQPVALLFAGSANGAVTIANPISEVQENLGVAVVGSCDAAAASDAPSANAGDAGMSKEAVSAAAAIRDRHESQLMSIPGAVGTAIGAGDQSGQPTIEVYVDKMTPQAQAAASQEVEGTPVKVIETGGFVAY
jgi:hypothetical protein